MYNIKALFAVKENGNVLPLVISNTQEKQGGYSTTIKIGNKTCINEYEDDEIELWYNAQEDSDIFPSDESMALYLKNVPSQSLEELLEVSNFDDTAIGFIIIEFKKGFLRSSTQDEYVRETVIFKEKNPFIYRSIDLAEELIPEVKEFYSRKYHFDYDRIRDIKSLRQSDSAISNELYGCKNGNIFVQTNNSFKPIRSDYDLECFDYDDFNELMERWDDTFNHLEFYHYKENNLCYFINDEISEMITTLKERKKAITKYFEREIEALNEQLVFIEEIGINNNNNY